MASKYEALGVDVDKKGIEALRDMTDDLFPGSFCSVVADPADLKLGIILHEDGAGSKPIVSYIYYKETGERHWFEPLAQDVIAMNVDDAVCIGANPIAFSDYVALNGIRLKKEDLLGGLARGFKKAFELLNSTGSKVLFSGGETADLPDIIKTFDVSGTVMARVYLSKVITGRAIAPGDMIVGLRSGGKATYETKENSGIMCNGISLVRHCLLNRQYLKKYPEVGTPEIKGYYGRFMLSEFLPELSMTIGEAILSPTRIYLPIVQEIMRQVEVKAMVHNTGGGLTKCMRLGKRIKYVKDTLPEPDPIFKLIENESKEDPWQMCRNFNMGIGFEVIVKKGDEEEVIRAAKRFGVEAQVIGHCERSAVGNTASVTQSSGTFLYR